MDAGLATKIAAYQRQMYSQAGYFNQQSLPAIINMMLFGSNFSALVNAFNSIFLSKSDDEIVSQLSQLNRQLESLSDQAQSYGVIAQSLNSKLQVAWSSLAPLMKNYQAQLDLAEKTLSKEAVQWADTIKTLNTTIAANIQSIVSEGNKAGDGVKLLAKGIITSLQVDNNTDNGTDKNPDKDAGKDADKKEDPSTEAEKSEDGSETESKPQENSGSGTDKPETPYNDESVEYMISGITAISSGTQGSSQAAKDLIANTEKVAKAYQALAKTNSVLAVAKSINAQNQLFVENYTGVAQAAATFPKIWNDIAAAYQDCVTQVNNLKSEDDIWQFKRALAKDTLQWQLLSQQIDSIKTVYAGNGTLPDAF
ncbi:hypothetical protein EB241_03140 [Erwinia psidii]|uniref:Uncharacterized protein n=2 Tax=Erwinia psidii TaxID=69224 RepID=A0A3N6V2X7_9GAMM|nr:hypothetical protein EB241_03140 [Erwinia psidii]